MTLKFAEEQIARMTEVLGPNWDKALQLYIKKLVNAVIVTIILLVLTAVAFFILLHACRIAWSLYQHTAVGQNYIIMNPVIAGLISDFAHSDMFHITVHYTLSAFFTCLAASIIFQLLSLTHFLYEPMGWLLKTLFFGLPLVYSVGFMNTDVQDQLLINRSVAIAALPTLILFNHCFHHTNRLLPEIKEALDWIREQLATEDQYD